MVGTTNNGIRRGLLAFDFQEEDFPSDAKVECAEIRLYANAVTGGKYGAWGKHVGTSSSTLHRVTSEWHTSGANVLHGVNGGDAKTGDATWSYTVYPTAVWNNKGGDYADRVVATQAGAGEVHSFGNTLRMTRIVQEWLDVKSDPFNAGAYRAKRRAAPRPRTPVPDSLTCLPFLSRRAPAQGQVSSSWERRARPPASGTSGTAAPRTPRT